MTECMEHFFAIFAILTFITATSSSQVVLENKPECDPKSCSWFWDTFKAVNYTDLGWAYKTVTPPLYSACDDLSLLDPQPNNWLRSDLIKVNEARRIDITVDYRIADCYNRPYCVNVFDLYVNQSNQLIEEPSQYPNPLQNTGAYERVAEIEQPINKRSVQAINVLVKGKYVLLAFHNYGSCSNLYSVKVTYNFCAEETLSDSLVSLPRTVAPANDSESIQVKGNCEKDAVQEQESLYIYCDSNGEWNISGLQGRCICKEAMQNVGGKCKACPDGKYNDQNGLNCTVLPSAPRNVNVTFVNQSSVVIGWLPPAITGDQTHVFYDVDCRKPCDDYDGNKCVDKDCGSNVTYIPYKEGLKVSHVKVTGLSSFVNYALKIYAMNRVSEVAKRRHGVEANFMAITVRTSGSTSSTTVPITGADSKTALHQKIIYGLVGLVGLLIISIVSFSCYKVNIRKIRRHQERAEQNGVSITTESGIRAQEPAQEDNTMFSMGIYQTVDDICDGYQLDRNQITLVRLLGAGNFGQVSKASYGASRSEVAVKTLKDNASQKDLQDMLSELDVMKSLQPHPHVVKLIGCCIERDPLFIVLEYLPYGDLLGYLRMSRGIEDTYNTGEKRPNSRLSEKDLLSFAWMIADGMDYLAAMKIVHRDLAARNVLVGEDKVCKISDFGLARGLKGDVYTRQTQARLPVKWMPPESIFYSESTAMSDVWSYGIVMWEVFTIGESPYPGMNSRQVAALLQTGYRMPRPRHLSEELYSIMSECWAEQPQKRPSFRWLCSAVRRLLDDKKTYVNLECYDEKDYVNFDMITK